MLGIFGTYKALELLIQKGKRQLTRSFVGSLIGGTSSPVAKVCTYRKCFLLSYIGSQSVKHDGTTLLILTHERRVLKVLNQGIFALNTGISDVAHFLTVELLPFLVVKFFIKAANVFVADEVNECISDVAFVLEINW